MWGMAYLDEFPDACDTMFDGLDTPSYTSNDVVSLPHVQESMGWVLVEWRVR